MSPHSSVMASSKLSSKMAVSRHAQPATSTIVSSQPPNSKASSAKMHRRSRSGCFTCRLRRKKCEEGKPECKACRHLGLQCDYKRPAWWGNSEQRRAQKESIKNIIKRTQMTKKSAPTQAPTAITTPPSLCHSASTAAEVYPDPSSQSRAHSIGSPYSNGCDFSYASPDAFFTMPPPSQPIMGGHPSYPNYSPYEVDIKTERSTFVNDVQVRKDSTMSTFSTYQPPPMSNGMPSFSGDEWVQQDYYETHQETFTEEPIDFNFFDFSHAPATPNHESIIDIDDCDRPLLKYFFEKVVKLIFPILDVNQHGSARTEVVQPALESNRAYLHCCLSTAATHIKATEGVPNEQTDNDIVRHRYAAISELCEQLNQDTDHARILEATLGMIFFQCSVGRPGDALPDIPWHQHFQAAVSLVNKLELPNQVIDLASSGQTHPPFNMALTSWIDILGATMIGRAPTFADTYRELNMSRSGAGLAELMGCDDNIMFLISEIACLDVQKSEGIDELILCRYVEVLATEIGHTEPAPGAVQSCISASGAIRPKQLSINISAVFRIAARIYLCTLVPGYEPRQPSICHLVAHFADLMNYIPAGPEGFDRSLVWPLLIAGSASVKGSPFRNMFADRCDRLGEAAAFGSFGRVRELLADLWKESDAMNARGEFQGVRWRDAMQQKGWDFLLI